MPPGRYSFGPFELDTAGGVLRRDGQPISLGQRGLALLEALLDADGQPVGKDRLLERAWPGSIVEEVNLTVQIAALRKALGTAPDGREWIVTVPRVGYRLPRPAALTEGRFHLPTLAVMPFHNLSGDPEQEYFADGMVDELITALSRFKSFAVIARSSSFARKGRPGDARQIAQELGVRYLLEGSVRRSGNRLRLAAQLADGADGATLWAQTFDGTIDDVFEFQDRITRSVAGVVEPRIQQAEFDRSQRERPSSIAGYDLYLRAVAKIYCWNPDDNAEAIRLLERALEIEPQNGLYLAFAAWSLEVRTTFCYAELGPDDRARCLEYAHKAVQYAPADPLVLAHCGVAMQGIGQEYERGLLVAERAVELNPNHVVALVNAGVAHLLGGDLRCAEERLCRAIDIQPNGAYEAMGVLAYALFSMGRIEEALVWAERTISLNANWPASHWVKVAANVYLGNRDAARQALADLLEVAPKTTLKQLLVVKPKERERDNNVLEGLRLAGLPLE